MREIEVNKHYTLRNGCISQERKRKKSVFFRIFSELPTNFASETITNDIMKKIFLQACAIVCMLGLMSSCDQRVTSDTVSGTYHGTMDVKINIPNVYQEELELPNKATVSKVDDAYVDITIDLNLTERVGEALSTLTGEDLNYGIITGRCLVGPTVDGEAALSGTATVGNRSIPVFGEYDERTLDVTFALGVVTVEFEGVRK